MNGKRRQVTVLFSCGFLLATFLFSGAVPGLYAAEKDGTVVRGDLGEKLDAAVQRVAGGGFWGAVLVARKGEVLLAKGYGSADYSSKPNDTRTLFEIASTSKQFTAAAVLKLEMEKKLSLQDPLSKFFKRVPKDKKDITVHQLLTHTSGMDPNVGLPYASNHSRKQFVRFILKEGLSIRVQPRYMGQDRNGKQIVDERITFILNDAGVGQWPIMVKMGDATARKLAKDLAKAAGK